MKKSDIFELPQRQSQFAIIFIILRFFKRILRQLWPLLAAFVLGRGGSSFDNIELAISGLGVLGLIPSIIAYYKFYFSLTDEELVIRKGLFKKVKLNIPFERIQSVNFRQTAIHQFFKVTEVEIETAGSSDQESKIDAIDIPTAELLRQRILERRDEVLKIDSGARTEDSDKIQEVEDETILQLEWQKLLRVGLTQNHLKPIGLLSGGIASLFFYAYTFDYDPMDFFKEIYSFIESLSPARLIVFVIMLFISSVIYSVITTILRHYNLRFSRVGIKFQVIQGLFTRQEFAALDKKIQILNWGQNPFERVVGFYNIVFKQARSSEQKRGVARFEIPGCNDDQVAFVKQAWLGNSLSNFNKYYKVSHHLFLHGAYYQVFFFSIPVIVLSYLGFTVKALLLGLFFIFLIWLSWLNYKKKKYAINGKQLYIGGGTLGLRHSLLPLYKVQDVSIIENPYQWRRNLSTLIVHTAAGQVKIPYIEKSLALELMDILIYHVESSNKAWI